MTDEEKYLTPRDLQRPPEQRAILIALGQSQSGESISQKCPFCGGSLVVDAKSLSDSRPCAWVISCSCGKCNCAFRGLWICGSS